ncbi:MAG: hypothetical protein ABSG15_10750, partial [FCB group bacterium]
MLKNKICGFILILCFAYGSLYAQTNVSLDAVYSNINTLSEKLATLKKKVNSMSVKLEKSNSETIGKLNHILMTVDSLNSELKIQGANISVLNENLSSSDRRIIDDSVRISMVIDSIILYKNKFTKINKSIDELDYNVAILENKIRKIPEIFFCPDCYPIFGVSFGLMKLFGKDPNIFQKYLSVAGGLNINLNNDFRIWFDVVSPLEFVDSKQNDTYFALFGSVGLMYNIYAKTSFSLKAGLGGFYGEIEKRINTDDINKIINPIGLTGKAEFSYNQ